jgi:hypothetical protein
MVDEFGMDNSQLSSPVIDLMEHIWKEATGELEDEISVSLHSIKLEQVFYAFYFQIRQIFQSKHTTCVIQLDFYFMITTARRGRVLSYLI